jgi:hypothetical protein
MRWNLRLSKFDFVIEHKAGTKIKHVAVLSRHVGALMEDSLPDKDFVTNKKQVFLWYPQTRDPLQQERILSR